MLASELARKLGCDFVGPGDPEIDGVAPIDEAAPSDVAFLYNRIYRRRIASTSAGMVVLQSDDLPDRHDFAAAISDNPHRCMAQAVDLLYPKEIIEPHVDRSANIDPSATIGKKVSIGAFARIGPGCVVGDGAIIGEGVVLGARVHLGPRCRLFPRVVVYADTWLGEGCIVHAGTVLGSDGFGFAPTEDGILKIRQVGRLIIEQDVEIGANCTVDRGSFTETRICRGTKIDNLVQIAHNCRIGECCLIASQTGLAGSTILGDRVMVGGQVGFAGHQKVGDGSIILAKSGVVSDVPPRSKLFGIPARNSITEHREGIYLARLGELFKRVKALEKKLEEK